MAVPGLPSSRFSLIPVGQVPAVSARESAVLDYTPLNDPPHITQEPGTGLRETQVASALMYQGKLLTLKWDIMRLPDGHNASREYLIHPGAVMMIPSLDDGIMLMEHQFRCPIDRAMIEFPVGKLDPQEGALTCGRRELCKKTGYTAEHWDYPTCVYPVISYSTKFIGIYLIWDLKQGETMLDEGGSLEALIASASQLIDWVRDGKVSDMKIIVGMLWLEKILSDAWTPGAT